MSVHKLTAGDGYTYLTRQVAAHDATDRGHAGLADYYAEKGESPGRWFGAGLGALGLEVGTEVTEGHMRNLFGEGRHPEAERLESAALDAGASLVQAKKAAQLGRVFARYMGNQPEFVRETARRYVAYNLSHGEHWRTPVPADVRARIRTELGDERFLLEHGRAPLDDRERGSFMAKATRQQTTAVAGYDLTFAPVKSVSTLWALADREVARQIEDAHHAAVEATLSWLEREVLFTRRGRGGIQQVRAAGLIAGMFTHRDARSSDPHLHTHVALSNKVQDATGRWLAVDGRVLFKANISLSETYNTLVETELVARLGVRFEDQHCDPGTQTGNGPEKRLVREIVGVDQRLVTSWSKRHGAIEARRRALAAAFQAAHGRPPTLGEAVTLAEKAWEQTRQAKHAPRAETDQRAAWLKEAVVVLGSEEHVRAMVAGCLDRRSPVHLVTDDWIADAARDVVARVSRDRATWQVWHLRAEAQRRARSRGMALVDLDEAVDRVVATAIKEHSIAFDERDPLLDATTAAAHDITIPADLQRRDAYAGSGVMEETTVSVYSLAGARQYTSFAVLDAEHRILEAARRTGGRTISTVRVGIAIAEAGANGLHLNAAQQSLVRAMATSGRAVQLALAPAGAGKTTALQVLTRAWQDSGGTVLGLAPSAVAAHELATSIYPEPPLGDRHARTGGTPHRGSSHEPTPARTDTLAKLVWHAQNGNPPAWMQAIGPTTLVLIDEAGMAATTDVAAAVDYITARGGQIRLVGDDRQLASVAAGGILRDITHHVGAVTLTEIHRFRHPDGSLNHAEAAATLALRAGDPSAIAYYADRGRIHVGDLGACADQAYAAWSSDRANDRANTDGGSILVAPTRELVAELNTRARNDRVAGLSDHQIGRVVTLADGTLASAGDQIITRQNDRNLRLTHTDWVKNGDRWHVTRVHPDGSLTVTHDNLRTAITLPATYTSTAVQLGYATTVHGAQGISTGTCHVVLAGDEDRNLLYVALSRGKLANHLYLNVTSDGDPHNLIRPEALIPPTAFDQLAAIVSRDGTPVSATTALREQDDPHQLLADVTARYHDALSAGAENLIGAPGMHKIDAHGEALLTGLTEAPAWPTLRSHLARLALDGHSPLAVLSVSVGVGTLTDAHDPAAVLDARIDDLRLRPGAGHATAPDINDAAPTAVGPLPWLPAIPDRLAHDPEWGPFVNTYHRLVQQEAASVRRAARTWLPASAPAWVQPFLEDEDTDLRADLAVWRAVARTDPNDLRPTGDRTLGAPGAYQDRLNRAARKARPSYPFAQRNWYRSLPVNVRADAWITPLCQRLARLERAGLPVGDLVQQALAGDPRAPLDRSDRNSAIAHSAFAATRPLPDEQQAAALWWRLVPHLGPAALDADTQSADLLDPTWLSDLADLVGPTKTDHLQSTPAWPALVAAVDEAREHHGWMPHDILSSALAGLPHGPLTGSEVADAMVLRIAMLTDEPATEEHTPDGRFDLPDPAADADQLPPRDADDFLNAFHRNQSDMAVHGPAAHSPANDGAAQPKAGPSPQDAERNTAVTTGSGVPDYPMVIDPYAPPPWQLVEAVTAEDAFPDPKQVPRCRIHELNRLALDFFESCYRRSWAPSYLRGRLSTDLVDHPTYSAGYAPGGGDNLIRHLTRRGATLDELAQAGLVRTREREEGTRDFRDVFADRLILPIRDPHDPAGETILGFVGRRNPARTHDKYAGPTYLNTRTTAAFTKGEALFGYSEARELLATGALPVIVEGPMDALAITLGSNGKAVGLATMGTALTVNQIKLLRATIDTVNGRNRIAVATDSDQAGRTAARKAFWNLTAADLDPTYLRLPDGMDPASLFEHQRHHAVTAIIENRFPLGDAVIDHLLGPDAPSPDTRRLQRNVREVARVLSARGPDVWPDSIRALGMRLDVAAGLMWQEVLAESLERDRDRLAYARTRIEEINRSSRRTSRLPNEPRDETRGSRASAARMASSDGDHGVPPISVPAPTSTTR